ncbi:MAG TPA: DUF427 domain-containing protein [Byssovorax sp.]|jgi:uncharacterized protein (DUF427 family)
MARATWNGVVLAESPTYELVEGNVYFPPGALKRELVRASETHTVCPWKGTASYFDVVTPDGAVNKDAVWFYPDPKPAAANIKDHVAFWRGVEVTK